MGTRAEPGPRDIAIAVFLAGVLGVFAIALATNWGGYLHTRITDLKTIVAALDRYHVDHGGYPVGIKGAGEDGATADAWIPELVPDYLARLPRDPRLLPGTAVEYLYISDGVDFKLIAHGAEDTPRVAKQEPQMIDPARSEFAYGFWTSGAAKW